MFHRREAPLSQVLAKVLRRSSLPDQSCLIFSENWRNLRNLDVGPLLKKGENRIDVSARNQAGSAGLLAWLKVGVSDSLWKTQPGEDPKIQAFAWKLAQIIATLGDVPWGNPWSNDATKVDVAEGFYGGKNLRSHGRTRFMAFHRK